MFHFSGISVVNDGAALYICNGAVEEKIFLDRGDTIIFRGDFVHAGAEYVDGHFGRLHVYINSPSVKYSGDETDPAFDGCPLVPRARAKRVMPSERK